MTFSWSQSRWRPLIMQAAIWLVLLATLGLAKFVDLGLRRAMEVPMAEPITDGRLSFRFPLQWKVVAQQHPELGTIYLASEPAAAGGRVLQVSRQRTGPLLSPLQYLYLTRQIVPGGEVGTSTESIGGWPTQIIAMPPTPSLTPNGVMEVESRIYCAVLPSHEAVVLKLDKPGRIDNTDRLLLRQMIANMELSDVPPPVSGIFELSNGAKVGVPGDVTAYPQTDSLDSSCFLLFASGEHWATADVIPVSLPTGQKPQTLRWALAHHELRCGDVAGAVDWMVGGVQSLGAGRWRFEPASHGDQVPRLAFLAVDADSGQGVLVALAGTAELDPIWQSLARGISLANLRPVNDWINNGVTFAARLAGEPPPPSDWWWLWSCDGQACGWSHHAIDLSHVTYLETRRRHWDNNVTYVHQGWVEKPDGTMITGMARYDPTEGGPQAYQFATDTIISDKEVETKVYRQASQQWLPVSVPRSSAFVGSDRLPAVLASLPAGTVALWTDRFPTCEGDLLNVPVLLIAGNVSDDVAGDAATRSQSSRPAVGLRCVQVEVSGTGQMSRWYFRGNGVLDHADVAGDLHILPSSDAETTAAVADDHRLKPAP